MSTAIYVNHGGRNFAGKNQDIPYDGAYLFINGRGLAKTAMIGPPHRPVQWVSRYGSVTVSQVAKEMPNGGINEAGLVVEQTTLWATVYPEALERPAIGELQWIQLMLDTCATVDEVIEAAGQVRIINPMSRLHYLVCDQAGGCAVIEFLRGEMYVYSGGNLPVPVLANTAYPEAIGDLQDAGRVREECKLQVDSPRQSKWRRKYSEYELNSMERFARAAEALEHLAAENGPLANAAAVRVREPSDSQADRLASEIDARGGQAVDTEAAFVFDILHRVKRADTAFSLVYDMDLLEIHFLSVRCPGVNRLRLLDLDFSAESRMAVNLQQSAAGSPVLETYTADLNRKVAESFFRDPVLTEAFGWTISGEMIGYLGEYPETFPLQTSSPEIEKEA
ncbi:linear amide C-N hydrolase [Paenibacillus sp. CN-4]|uniref:linear amide C-N hydrolase n=1 Tax=Paenibacillus nanchangensis TaxID=3348343 RepID=UPI00397DCFA5